MKEICEKEMIFVAISEDAEAVVKTTLKREIMELFKVREQLRMSNEAGQLPGEKAQWCIDKLGSVIADLGHASNFFEL